MFEQATRLKLRFETDRGLVSVEDLWDLPLTGKQVSLDSVAKKLNKQIKESEEESFVTKPSTVNKGLQLKMDIVKHVIAVRLEEQEKSKKAADARAEKQKITEILARKQEASLENKSEEELQEMLKKLEG